MVSYLPDISWRDMLLLALPGAPPLEAAAAWTAAACAAAVGEACATAAACAAWAAWAAMAAAAVEGKEVPTPNCCAADANE